MRFSGGDLIARTLGAAGVDTLFTLCGGHISPILNGCVDRGVRIIDMRHESAAAIAADAYACATQHRELEHTLQMKRALFDAR